MAEVAKLGTSVEPAPVITMSVEEWLSVPDNPRQRDTERHLRRAKHLMTPSITHSRVIMAICPRQNKRWKLDGHTRALAWARRMVDWPKQLIVMCYNVADQAEAELLYSQFDASEAVETTSDKMTGAFRALGFQPKSKRLMQAGITYGLRLAQGCAEGQRFGSKESIYVLTGDWLKELQRFDQINANMQRFTAPLVAASFLTFRKHGTDILPLEFWGKYNDDAGEKIDEAMDPVEALSRFMLTIRGSGPKKAASGSFDVIGKGLAAFEAYRKSGTYTRNLVAMDATRYLLLR